VTPTLRERYDEAKVRLAYRDRFGDGHLDSDIATVIEYADREAEMVVALASICEDACEGPDYRPRTRNEWIAWAIAAARRRS
jgi:hypothetical protein